MHVIEVPELCDKQSILNTNRHSSFFFCLQKVLSKTILCLLSQVAMFFFSRFFCARKDFIRKQKQLEFVFLNNVFFQSKKFLLKFSSGVTRLKKKDIVSGGVASCKEENLTTVDHDEIF